jgi:hypothetical protein
MYTGKEPFYYIKSASKVQMHVIKGNIPRKPTIEDCITAQLIPDLIWSSMLACWYANPAERLAIETFVTVLARSFPTSGQ